MYMFAIALPRYFAVVASFQTFESYILMYVPLPIYILKKKKKRFLFCKGKINIFKIYLFKCNYI